MLWKNDGVRRRVCSSAEGAGSRRGCGFLPIVSAEEFPNALNMVSWSWSWSKVVATLAGGNGSTPRFSEESFCCGYFFRNLVGCFPSSLPCGGQCCQPALAGQGKGEGGNECVCVFKMYVCVMRVCVCVCVL